MMSVETVLKLIDNGFSHDEILQMDSKNNAPAEPPVKEPTPAPAKEPAPVPAPEPVKEPKQEDTPKEPKQEDEPKEPTLQDLMKEVARLTSAVQANAIAHSMLPAGAVHPEEQADSAIASIIRPTYKERS